MKEQFGFQTAPFNVGGERQGSGQHGRWFRRDDRIIVLLDSPPVRSIWDNRSVPAEKLGVSFAANSQGESEHGTDYTPRQIIDARYTQAVQRHDQSTWTVYPITANYNSNFDEFAASVAYALRDKLYYRRDGGKNARGLVRATGDLQVIHSLYRTGTPPPANGTPIQLNAIFGRRQDPRANMRWVMVIRFNDSHGRGFVDVDVPDVIVADPHELQRKTMAIVLTQARSDCQNLPGNRGKRICEMVSIAERLNYPRNWDLWYYERSLVDEYVNWRTGNARRREMTQNTGGRLPFDGQVASPPGDWRIYPFRQAAISCSRQGADCKAIVHNTLVHAEDEMQRTFEDINKMFSIDSAAVFGPLVDDFRKHLVSLIQTPDSLYSAFGKYPN